MVRDDLQVKEHLQPISKQFKQALNNDFALSKEHTIRLPRIPLQKNGYCNSKLGLKSMKPKNKIEPKQPFEHLLCRLLKPLNPNQLAALNSKSLPIPET